MRARDSSCTRAPNQGHAAPFFASCSYRWTSARGSICSSILVRRLFVHTVAPHNVGPGFIQDRSALGKRDSSAQRQTAQNRIQARNGLRGDRNAAARARQLRAPWPSPGNLQVRKIANQTVMSAPLVPRIVSRSHCSPRSGNAPPRFLHFSRLKVRPAARGQQPSQNSVYWRKVGDADRAKLHLDAKMLKSLALPRGLEPLFSP